MDYTQQHPFLKQPKKLFIGGDWVDALSGKTFDVVNPSTGQVIVQVAEGAAADVDRAVAAARAAFEGPWSQFKPFDRQALLLKIADLAEERFDELAWLETLDMGAPIARTAMFKRFLLQALRFYAAQAVGIYGETTKNSFPGDMLSYSLRDPIGVVAGIIPWNGPLISQLWSIGPTLATGCTLVLKPAEDAPLSALALAQIMQDAGLPDGVVNVVPGYGHDAGAALASHPDVDKIAFTGSTATGRRIMEMAATNMKRVSVELGGKSADIVFGDADLDRAVAGAALGCFNNTGQICYAGSRILVQRSIHDDFVQRLAEYAKTLKVGHSIDPTSQLGPIVSARQLQTVTSYIDIAREGGAEVIAGGTRLGGDLAGGFFVPPTVLVGVSNDMRVAREEIFGPVASVIPFDDAADAVRIANDTQYGLGGAVWTRDLSTAHRVVRAVRTGMMWVNCYGATEPAVTSEGFRMSGFGAKGGRRHIDEYLYTKSVWLKLD
ncbi:aldehyde dehydrogenase [Sphingomonas glacialis]|uniref:Aldehyde dehydrogenase n=1 Tax=Sphingomonas glacialis TaxID=658225 RepID=A0ABQ3LSE0_9SPHN|nr:aldehyde dehydrogenase family protein [Sphingomonas glacialis]GHH23988.1 aldehyde dehydrogenase [Sphingomonas glacialis]